MNTQTIDGKCYARMLLGGAAALSAHAQELNDLNVFPVCDGDTGTNMSRTLEGGLAQLQQAQEESIGALTDRFSRGVLLAARGNSGVILSQIFAGITEGFRGCDRADARTLAGAYIKGIDRSYSAVQNPTEGTILTVFRESTRYAADHIDDTSSVGDFFRLHIDEARRSLARTPELLPVLAEAEVIDSGAAGYLCIAEGMYEALTGKDRDYAPVQAAQPTPDIDRFTRDSKLEFGYCTEFLLRLTTAKTDPDTFRVETLVEALEALGGESIVAYKQEDIVKVHVHTFQPGQAMAAAQRYGEFLTVKVENMSLGHSETPKKTKHKPYCVVAVASGQGIVEAYTRLGADRIISGGQTANPSAQEFIDAFRDCQAEHILVLPNNKNVFLAAKQAAELYDGAKVHIIPTRSIMAGYCALSVITPGIKDIEALVASATRAAQDATDFEITRAVRDAAVEGHKIREGDYMALGGDGLAAVADTPEGALLQALETADMDLCEIITVFAGCDVSQERREALAERLEDTYPDCEVTVYDGGQTVYDYLVSAE